MAYFKDLTAYTYLFDKCPGVLSVGWLGKAEKFNTGDTSGEFRAALEKLCKENGMNYCRGYHVCEFCSWVKFGDRHFDNMGNGEIRVRDAGGVWYVAPRLIIHYVLDHNYRPPEEFVEAVLNPSEIGRHPELPSSDRELREALGPASPFAPPPMTEAEINEVVGTETRNKLRKKRWWQFWR